MKKRLLITSALMTAVLGASLATGTYAWYQAAAGQATYTPATSGNIGTVANGYTTGSFTVSASISEPSTKVALTDTNGDTYYYLQDGTTKVLDESGSLVKSASVSVNISITYTADGLTDAEIAAAWAALNIDEISVSVTSTGKVKLGTTAEKAEKAGETVTLSFDVADVDFTSKVYTGVAQTVYYGVKANESAVEQPTDEAGTITVTPSAA